MKRFLVVLGAIVLLLVGCTDQATPTTEQTTSDPTVEETQTGLYVSSGEVEKNTDGAIREYRLEGKRYDTIAAVGEKVLLVSREKNLDLVMLSGADGIVSGRATIKEDVLPDKNGYRATYNGVVYYDAKENCAVYLDSQLQELNRVALPDDLEGVPVFSDDGVEVFYCVGQEIRGYNTEMKISRLVKSQLCTRQELLNGYFGGRILSCNVVDTEGESNTLWISTETGQTVATDNLIEQLWTFEDDYLALRTDGSVQQRIFGKLDGKPKEMTVMDGQMVSALELGSTLRWVKTKKGVLKLSVYNLSTGKKTAAISTNVSATPKSFLADRWSQCVWILMEDENQDYLLRWDLSKSKSKDKTNYTSKLRTKDSPDTEGLQALQDRVDALNRKHGLRIRIWESAAKYPTGITMEAEYQVYALDRALDELEDALDQFPEDFLYKSVKDAIRVCIVRSIDGEVKSGQYWFDGDPFIVISAGMDVEEEFLKNIGFVVDSHVLGNSPQFDYWPNTNPENFVYGDTSTFKNTYLLGDTRYFVDEASTQSATDDRTRIFWQAMKKDNAEMFQSAAMQKKLKQICLGIRDAWRWERKTEEFPWEQYLDKSIAYVEK